MKIAIVDDEPLYLEQVVAIAKEYEKERTDKKIVFDIFSHPEDLLESSYRLGGYDIYVLDVIMPGMDGIELGKKLREANYDGKIVYLTSSPEFAYDSFSVKAFNYILKPAKKDVFFHTIDEAIASISDKKDKALIIKTKEKSTKINFDSIMYAELANRAITYYLVGGKKIESTTVRSSFSESVAELLTDKRFIACSQSMVVNLDHITEVENDTVFFGNTYKTSLGEKNCRKLRNVWSNYLFEQEG